MLQILFLSLLGATVGAGTWFYYRFVSWFIESLGMSEMDSFYILVIMGALLYPFRALVPDP